MAGLGNTDARPVIIRGVAGRDSATHHAVRADVRSPLFVVVALMEPLAPGAKVSRRAWPAHVTLASNFIADVASDVLADIVRSGVEGQPEMWIRFAEEARFGSHKNIPVQLVESDRVAALHERLASLVENLPGFAAAEPAFWHGGYRAHMTHVSGIATPPGSVVKLSSIALATLSESTATIVTAVPI